MALPKFHEMYVPSLQLLERAGRELTVQEIKQLLREWYNIADEDYIKTSEKGNNIFSGRISWCLSGLYRSGLVEKPKLGFYRITGLGHQKLHAPDSVTKFVKDETDRLYQEKTIDKVFEQKSNDDSPNDTMDKVYQEIKEHKKQEILSMVLQKKPSEFERLTLALLKAMGYGGAVQNAHKQTKLSHDGGIDGIIKEDILGLGHIYIQAKRYTEGNNVGRTEIQQFVGAISTAQSNKGIFITTSDFSQGAYDYANKLTDKSIVLINGDQLTEYMYEYGLGVQCETIYEIKKIDQDFWSNYIDE